MTSASRLEYRRIDSRSIRVLILKPATSFSKPIECQLQHASLTDLKGPKAKQTYEALSYTWGARNGTVPITCDGQPLLVTPNCESALRYLRNKFTKRVLWVDAICINQQSVDERNIQVPLMDEIYTFAKKVIIWLGAGAREEEDLLRHARIGGAMHHTRGLTKEKVMPEGRIKNLASKIINDREVELVRHVCNNIWFTRIWTLQEIVLATSAVFQIGHTECPTTSLYSYFLVAESFSQSDSLKSHRFQMRNRLLERLHPELSNRSFYIHTTHSIGSAEHNPEELLAMAWQLASLSDATDVRDKAYGMYGLLKSLTKVEALPKVDYNKSVPQIFEETTRSLIELSQSLWPLEIISHFIGGGPSDLPSWVPNLRNLESISTDWRPGCARFVTQDEDKKLNIPDISKLETKLNSRVRERYPEKFSKKAELSLPDTVEVGKLPVKACYLAEIAEVYTRMPIAVKGASDEDALRMNCLSEWTAIASNLEETEPAHKTPPGGFLTAIRHLTPALGNLRKMHSPEQDENFEDLDCPSVPQPKDVYDGAVLFRTSEGLLGLCKGEVRPQDKLWQLAGGRYPFVLHREVNEVKPKQYKWTSLSFSAQEKVYSMVGIADVHGLVNGHAEKRWHKDFIEDLFHDIVLI